MHDREISLNAVAAYVLWILGGLLIILDLTPVWATPNGLAEMGLFLAGIGAVLTIRGFFCDLSCREKAAFDLGRESGVRSVRH